MVVNTTVVPKPRSKIL